MKTVTITVGHRKYSEDIDPEGYDPEQMRPLPAFSSEDIEQFNGNHFIYGWYECFMQSGEVPLWIAEADELTIEVK